MIPLRDDQPTFSTPFVNYFLIVLNVLVFMWELSVSHRALAGSCLSSEWCLTTFWPC